MRIITLRHRRGFLGCCRLACSAPLDVPRGANAGRKSTEPTERYEAAPRSDPIGRPSLRRANNLTLQGGGLHHVAVEASDFDRSLRFYTEGLSFQNVLTFPEEDRTVAMLDAGDATYVELFSGGSGEKTSGSILHLALRTGDCDTATE